MPKDFRIVRVGEANTGSPLSLEELHMRAGNYIEQEDPEYWKGVEDEIAARDAAPESAVWAFVTALAWVLGIFATVLFLIRWWLV